MIKQLFLILLFPLWLQSQDTIPYEMPVYEIQVLAERKSNTVTLRWAPSSPELWLASNNGKYRISRMEVKDSLSLSEPFLEIGTAQVVHKKNWEEFLNSSENNDKYSAVAYECIHGSYKSMDLGTASFGAMLEQSGELKNKYGFGLFAADMDSLAAKQSGLSFVDHDVQEGKSYVYEVTALLDSRHSISFSSGVVLVGSEDTKFPQIDFQIRGKDDYVQLIWLRSRYKGIYSAYQIERKSGDGKFKKVNEIPYIHGQQKGGNFNNEKIVFLDSIAVNSDFEYRIAGYTPFGHLGPYSDVNIGRTRDLTPPPSPNLNEPEYLISGEMKLEWEESKGDDLAGYNVYKSFDYEHGFEQINDDLVDSTVYLDTSVVHIARQYYYVTAVDTAGNESASYKRYGLVDDKEPPSIPSGLTGEIDSSGIIRLKWNKNPEIDIRGYKVFLANADYHEYSLITGNAISDTFLIDTTTLNTLTEEIYFKVMAVDLRYNYSAHSQSIRLERPDIIPPTAPIFTDYSVEEKSITLEWANSDSKDVVVHQLLRKQSFSDNYTIVQAFTEGETEYMDTKIVGDTKYIYKVIAIDDADLISPPTNELILKSLKKWVSEEKPELSVAINKDVLPEISWILSESNTVSQILLYKGIEDQGFLYLKSFDGNIESKFIDHHIIKGRNYSYAIKYKYSDGSHSKFSEVQNIKIQSK